MQAQPTDAETSSDLAERCDLCVIGAGIAGLNALFVAAEHLPRDTQVVVIDTNPEAGGMWSSTESDVRLYQPHRLFTVGNMRWHLARPADYRATGAEVRRHLQNCFRDLGRRLRIVGRFGHRAEHVSEPRDGGPAEVLYRDLATGRVRRLLADRVIRASGHDIPRPEPLPLSSRDVRSLTPQDLGSLPPGVPVYVIGGGRVGLDCVLALARNGSAGPVVLINGAGTSFPTREQSFPGWILRWWRGEPASTLYRRAAMRFDGDNAKSALAALAKSRTIHLPGRHAGYSFAPLSKTALRSVQAGLSDLLNEHLIDVEDTDRGPEMVFRSGTRRWVERGAVVVNCTGEARDRTASRDPVLSPGGQVLTLNTRSMVHVLSGVSAWVLTHLFLSGRLAGTPLWSVDADALRRVGAAWFTMTAITVSLHNMIVARQALNPSAMRTLGMDADRYYPVPRRILHRLRGRRLAPAIIDHCRHTMERVQCRTGARCGPIDGPNDGPNDGPVDGPIDGPSKGSSTERGRDRFDTPLPGHLAGQRSGVVPCSAQDGI
ncbi:MAG: hypothetical protein CML66_11695 [Rhodobacteraceae bacterium]|nr:hypothetical protein [Paracoccaceae bacterium]